MSREIWHIDNVTEACGWFTSDTTVNNGYGCRHPEQEDVEHEWQAPGEPPRVPAACGRCFTFTCPLGSSLNPDDEPEDAEEFRRHGMDPAEFSDGEWMLVSVENGRLVGAAPEVT